MNTWGRAGTLDFVCLCGMKRVFGLWFQSGKKKQKTKPSIIVPSFSLSLSSPTPLFLTPAVAWASAGGAGIGPPL